MTANESGQNSSTNLLLSLISDLLRQTAPHLVQCANNLVCLTSADIGSNAVIKKAQKERGQTSAGCMLEQQDDTGVCWKEHVTIFMAGFAVQK